ncbi:hypothetical protein NDU88_001090 [Pleurodeles waltl]|uniref:Uncharacterized protein n=1 Tax=Pleurodeles waltl TaxID=8319 RepID=A0AAV7R809_PLEWA|nr:hypothetical protein NDU88_001090 [Pleurodeles waltl]
MASFDDNRDTLAAELFSRKPLAPRTTDSTTAKEGLRQKFIKLERLRKQELARWWDITTLKRYLELKQVPRGLRVIIFPSFEDLDPDLLGEWEHLISSTSFSMINILIKHADRKRTKLLQDIASLEEEIKNLNLPEATDKNHTIMREILTGYQLYIKDKKMRKLVRDDNDYSNGRIYTFARKFDQFNKDSSNRPTKPNTPAGSTTGSLSDISNLSSDCSESLTEGSSANTHPLNTTQQSNSFLEELGRYRKGLRQNYNRFHNMASFDDNRDTLAAELFSRKPLAPRTTDSTTAKEGLRQKFIRLERLRKQELARWWDITTLKRYLELKQVPRGLRVIIFPSFEDLDPDLLGEWEHLISSTSFSMINILTKHADRKRTKLLQDIASLEEEIKNLNLPEATDKNHTIMREILTGYQLYIKDKKMLKLVRDDNDYGNGRIYTFARKFDQFNKDSSNRPTKPNTPAGSTTGSLSDISNLSSDCSESLTEGSSANTHPLNTTQQSNSFLEELGRYRKGLRQNYNRSGINTNPPAGGAGNTTTNTREGMTTSATAKTQRP